MAENEHVCPVFAKSNLRNCLRFFNYVKRFLSHMKNCRYTRNLLDVNRLRGKVSPVKFSAIDLRQVRYALLLSLLLMPESDDK